MHIEPHYQMLAHITRYTNSLSEPSLKECYDKFKTDPLLTDLNLPSEISEDNIINLTKKLDQEIGLVTEIGFMLEIERMDGEILGMQIILVLTWHKKSMEKMR